MKWIVDVQRLPPGVREALEHNAETWAGTLRTLRGRMTERTFARFIELQRMMRSY